ncbi:MAG: DegT/DnrJ/EryC1/StrS family aminotransferase [Coriobacteriia bacterium]|nr:DegT/DnrJ/EryC1/StrS family aminotransferase [Coriobacteriia bacterium]
MADTRALALDGGAPAITRALPTWPQIPEEGVEVVAAVLRSGKINYWTGTQARQFEAEFAVAQEAEHALAVANGTLALELAVRSFGIGAGDEVIVPSRTFLSTAGAVVAAGAMPIIADIDPGTGAVTPLSVAKCLTPRTRAVIVVHVGGYPAPVAAIRELTDQLDLVVIEDCAQAQGARYDARPVGTAAHAGCFSFCQDKILPLGEGGMICYSAGIRQEEAYQRAWAYRDHGHAYVSAQTTQVQERSSQFKYLSESFGTNARLTEAQGALGRVLLRHVPAWHEQRMRNAELLTGELADFAPTLKPLVLPQAERERGDEQAYYRLYFLLDPAGLAPGWSRDRVIDAIAAEGAPVQFGSCALIGRERAFETLDVAQTADLSGARRADEQSLAFFVHPTLTADDMTDIVAAARKVLSKAVRQGS